MSPAGTVPMAWLLGLLALGAFARGAEPAPAPTKPAAEGRRPQGPVQIRSDELTVQQKQRSAIFSGNVQTVQGELTILSRRLDVHYSGSSNEPGAAGDIRSMVFTGDVRIAQGERRGHCQRAEYDRPRGRIVCTGDPWVVEGENRIEGERIIYLLERDEVRVVRPKAVLTLPEPPAPERPKDKK